MKGVQRRFARSIRGLLRRAGFDLVRYSAVQPLPSDFGQDEISLYRRVSAHTMTSAERVYALAQSIEHVVRSQIDGDIVECGVWDGGSMMAAALTLQRLGVSDRDLWLFDTFEGMTSPTEFDVDGAGRSATEQLGSTNKSDSTSVWCYAPLERVQVNMKSTGYPDERIHYVKGPVETTVPSMSPERIAVLRLDTDWYESTRHELHHLFPLVASGGILIIDDYGHWKGARRAVDEYLAEHRIRAMLHRIDYTGRMLIKP